MATNNKIFMEVLLIMCLCWQYFLCYYVVISWDGCMEIERNALLLFKEDLEDPWDMLSSWKDGVDCCKWKGVGCHLKTGRVMSLDLHDQGFGFMKIRGNELNSSLANLKDLRYLDMSGNDFGGISIPSFIGSFERLRYLNLSGSSFAGVVPSQLGNLSNLIYLDLSRNQFKNLSGSWISGFSSLKHLDLSYNDISTNSNHWLETLTTTLPYLVELHLSGCILIMEKLPKSLGNLCSLRKLTLNGNQVRGGIGELIDGFSTCNTSRLEILDLSLCFLGGFLPNSLGHLNNLKYLNLARNFFVGNIPQSIGNLTSLVHFLISENQLNGSIPESIGKLSYLSVLDLSFNPWNSVITEQHLYNLSSLTELELDNAGTIEINLAFDITSNWIPPFQLQRLKIISCRVGPKFPIWLRNQYMLKRLHLRYTMISDTIPDWFQNLGLSLYDLDLRFNNLSGEVPNTLDFEDGAIVDLSSNQFEGQLPQFSSPNISALYMSHNMFSGSIPHNIAQLMPKLTVYDVSNNYLYGNIPSFMGNMSSLVALYLSNNIISGAIPDSICSLRSLSLLWLSNNNFVGEIPSSIGNLSSISDLNLSKNKFVGKIPISMDNLSLLSYLDLSNNNFDGEIPNLKGNLRSLSVLLLNNNNLVGEIPSWIENVSSLEILLLNNNHISGVIPSSIGYLESLIFLSLSNNNLIGEIPPSLQKCRNMVILDLADNMISGEIPSWMGETTQKLQVLKLRSNQFVGHIPKQLCTVSSLHFMDLAHNHLSGTIPLCIGNLTGFTDYPNFDIVAFRERGFMVDVMVTTKGTEYGYGNTLYFVNLIDLSINNLTGDFPKSITALSKLWSLNLSMNHLTGSIPDDIGSLNILETLDLSFNRLSGKLPPSLAYMTSLNHPNLSYNDFEGRIPNGNQLQTLLDPSIYMNNPQLCGTPLNIKCSDDVNNQNPPTIIIDDDKDEWKWLLVSMALGFAVGFVGFLGPLVMKQSLRRAYFGFVEDKFEAIMIGMTRVRIKLLKSNVN